MLKQNIYFISAIILRTPLMLLKSLNASIEARFWLLARLGQNDAKRNVLRRSLIVSVNLQHHQLTRQCFRITNKGSHVCCPTKQVCCPITLLHDISIVNIRNGMSAGL